MEETNATQGTGEAVEIVLSDTVMPFTGAAVSRRIPFVQSLIANSVFSRRRRRGICADRRFIDHFYPDQDEGKGDVAQISEVDVRPYESAGVSPRVGGECAAGRRAGRCSRQSASSSQVRYE